MGPIDTLGNTPDFSGSTNGTCSGTGIFDSDNAVIAADTATDAADKCNALAGAASVVVNLGRELLRTQRPSADSQSVPGYHSGQNMAAITADGR
jgi:hypothetical protein